MTGSKLFSVQRDGDVLILDVHEQLSSLDEAAILDELQDLLDRLNDAPVAGVVVDFERVDYFGSSMLEAMRTLWNRLRSLGGRLVLCNCSPVGRDILAMSKFDTLWPICDDRAAAVTAVRAPR